MRPHFAGRDSGDTKETVHGKLPSRVLQGASRHSPSRQRPRGDPTQSHRSLAEGGQALARVSRAATELVKKWADRDRDAIGRVDRLLSSAQTTIGAVEARVIIAKSGHIERTGPYHFDSCKGPKGGTSRNRSPPTDFRSGFER